LAIANPALRGPGDLPRRRAGSDCTIRGANPPVRTIRRRRKFFATAWNQRRTAPLLRKWQPFAEVWNMAGLGWLLAIIVGALAGWIAEKVMHADHGLLTNIVLGILGAVILNAILGATIGYQAYGIIANLVVGILGACLLIGGYRMIRRA